MCTIIVNQQEDMKTKLTLFDVPSRYAAESTSGSLLFAVLREAIVLVSIKEVLLKSNQMSGREMIVILRALFAGLV
jgi:hypothetical protein